SYPFPSAGYSSTIVEGGVSLGTSRTLSEASAITDAVPLALRRGAIDYSTSSKSLLANLRGTKFELPAPALDRAAVMAEVPSRAHLRMGTTEIATKRLTTEVAGDVEATRISVGMDGGSLDSLGMRRTADGVRLEWVRGSVEADRTILQEVANEVAAADTAA